MTRETKTGIWTGVVASLIVVYFIQPILDFTVKVLSTAFGVLSHNFLDSTCRTASIGVPYDGGFTLLAMLFGAICGALVFTLSKLWYTTRRTTKVTEQPAKDHLAEHITLRRQFKLFRVVATIAALPFLGVGLYFFSQLWLSTRMVTSFHQHLDALSPNVTPQQLQVWKSQWAQMESQRDYEVIYSEMRGEAKRAGVKLLNNAAY